MIRRLVLSLALLGASLFATAGSVAAVCADPLSANSPLVHLSDTGLEVDWGITVKSGCTGSRFRVVVSRDTTADPGDVRSVQVYADPTTYLGPGSYTLTGILPAPDPLGDWPADGDPGWAVLYVDGIVYRIVALVPADYA